MAHFKLSERLKSLVSYDPDEIDLGEGLILSNHDFLSTSTATPEISLQPLRAVPEDLKKALPEGSDLSSLFETPDDEIEENRNFRYHVLRAGKAKSDSAIILLHGFNERHWDKYLPMGASLARSTGRAVFLFPIAFHMNRSPAVWHNARLMNKVSQHRKKAFPDVIQSTLSNAAISARLHIDASRFFWSGLQSFEDVGSLVSEIKAGRHPAVNAQASVNFFTYSIGTLLGEIIMMTNQDGHFSDSKFVTFCVGPVFNRLSHVSKFILDSVANVGLYSFLIEHLDSHRRRDPKLDRFLGGTEVGHNFRALLNYRLEVDYREDKLRGMASRIMAVALAKDEVVPPFEVVNTLQGSRRDIPIDVETVDFPYPYRHEDPFPLSPKYAAEVDSWFEKLFSRFGAFLK
jgi:hypothetical protein